MIYILGFLTIIVALFLCKYIKKNSSSIAVRYIYYEIIFNCFIRFFVGCLHFPSFLSYFSDVIFLLLCFQYFKYKKEKYKFNVVGVYKKSLILYCLICLFSYIFNLYSPLLFVWGVRNNLKFILYSYFCCCFIKKEDLKLLYPILLTFFVINFIIVLYQSFFMSYVEGAIGDFISGLYSNGENRGGNASLCWLMCIGVIYSLVSYFYRRTKIKQVVFWIICSIIISALNETKIFYINLVIISIVSIIITKKSIKTIFYVVISLCLISMGINLLYHFNSKFINFFNSNNIIEYAESSYSKGGMDRISAIGYSYNNYLNTFKEKVIGIGIGNADYSSIDCFTSDFYKRNSSSGYTFFSTSMTVIETGSIGLISYLLILFSSFFSALKLKLVDIEEKIWKCISINVFVLCLISFFSTQVLRLEPSAYLIFLILSIPTILERCNGEVKSYE